MTNSRDSLRGILSGAAVVGGLTMVSRVLGLLRILCFAWFIDTQYLDLFFIAFLVPNLFRRLVGEGALTSAFVPIFTERLEHKDTEGAQALGSKVMTALLVSLGGVVLVGEGLCLIAAFMVSNHDNSVLITLLQIMLPYTAMICGAALLMAILNSHRRFAVPALSPIILNVVIIAATLLFAQEASGETAVKILAVAVLVGGLLQFGIQLPLAHKLGFRFKPKLDFKDENVQRVKNLFLPVVIGVGVFQINVLADNLLAKFMIAETGPVTHLMFGMRLVQVPLAVLGVAMSTASLPALSALAARNNMSGFKTTLLGALRVMLFIVVPVSVALAVLAEPLVELLFHHGRFSGTSPARTAWVVVAGSVGLVGFCITMLLARAFHALNDTRTPVKVAAFTVVLNLVLNVIFLLLDNSGSRAGNEGRILPAESLLALASSITFYVQAIVLAVLLWRRMGIPISTGGTALVSLAGLGAAGTAGVLVYRHAGDLLDRFIGFIFQMIAGGEDLGPTPPLNWAIPAEAIAGIIAAALIYAMIIFGWLWSAGKDKETEHLALSFLRVCAVSACMGYVLFIILKSLPIPASTPQESLWRVVAPAVLGTVFFWFSITLFSHEEYNEVAELFKREKRK